MASNIEIILDKARWAPSGDNEQPCRVRILSPDSCEITTGYFLNTIFHLNRHSDHIALGCFIENMAIAASDLGFNFSITKNNELIPAQAPSYHIILSHASDIRKDPLAKYIEQRSVNRFPYAQKPLTAAEKESIQQNLPTGFKVKWLEGPQKAGFASVVFKAAALRYLLPEMFDVHSKIIDWKNDKSMDKIPSKALGMLTIFLPVMQWMLGKPHRMAMYNQFFVGHYGTAFKLEYLPNIFSSAGIALVKDEEPKSADDWISVGRAIQRFWLAATALGLSHQPAYTPMLFSKYADEEKTFSTLPNLTKRINALKNQLSAVLGGDEIRKRTVWLGRIGYAQPLHSRSIRRPLVDIIKKEG